MIESAAAPAAAPERERSYLERLAAFETKLLVRMPAPQEYEDSAPPAGVEAITYPSGGRALKAWFAMPAIADGSAKVPAVVFFHGGFSFAAGDFEGARPFIDAGYALLMPMLRGENGNPGDYEMFLGEVDDAAAAIAWLAAHDGIDAKRIYTFGHSIGGHISALLALRDVPVRHGGSSGGLYGSTFFTTWREVVPFAHDDAAETSLRLLVGNLRWMKRPHYAFMGENDALEAVSAARDEAARSRAPLGEPSPTGLHQACMTSWARCHTKLAASARLRFGSLKPG